MFGKIGGFIQSAKRFLYEIMSSPLDLRVQAIRGRSCFFLQIEIIQIVYYLERQAVSVRSLHGFAQIIQIIIGTNAVRLKYIVLPDHI